MVFSILSQWNNTHQTNWPAETNVVSLIFPGSSQTLTQRPIGTAPHRSCISVAWHKVQEHPHLIVLCRYYFFLYFVFYKLKVCGNPASSKSIGTIFPTAFVHFVSLYHIFVNSCNISHFYHIYYSDQWSLMLLLLFWGTRNHTHIRWRTLLRSVCNLTASLDVPLSLYFSLGPLFPKTTVLKLGQLITLQRTLKI